MEKKVVVSCTSLVLVVVCVGAIITLVHSMTKARSDLPSSIHTTSKASKAMTTRTSLCSTALHKESCELMLSNFLPKHSSSQNSVFDASLAQNPSLQTQVFKSFIEVTLSELEIAVNRSVDVASGKVAGRTAAAKNDCEKLLTDALHYTRASVALLGDKDIESLRAEANDIGYMLTAAMTYMYTCVDGFHDPKLNTEMDRILSNATVMGSNALGVINSIFSSVVKPKSPQAASRKLLGYDMDQQGYPTWLSTGERKLLQAAR